MAFFALYGNSVLFIRSAAAGFSIALCSPMHVVTQSRPGLLQRPRQPPSDPLRLDAATIERRFISVSPIGFSRIPKNEPAPDRHGHVGPENLIVGLHPSRLLRCRNVFRRGDDESA